MIDRSLLGKTCLITGTARGMGRIAARELAKLGARLWDWSEQAVGLDPWPEGAV